ncbi:hypothetical protein [Planococcus lenghuensis]|nr:hypothetical protein [Planococcus lenghuensis]
MGKRKSPEYKEYVVKLLLDDDRRATEVACELERKPNRIRRWAVTRKHK